MLTIYKHELEERDTSVLYLPEQSEILKVGRQGDKIYLWIKSNTDNVRVPTTIRIFGTGHLLPPEADLTYLDTIVMSSFVWHVFKENN